MTTLSFDDREVDFAQHAVTASVGYSLASDWNFSAAVGAILGGSLTAGDRTFDIGNGLVAALAVSRQAQFGRAYFVNGTASLSGSFTSATEDMAGAESHGLRASDLRLGVTAGRTFFDRLSPYLLARGFAGPVSWTLDGEDVVGSDIYHFQLGLGASAMATDSLSVILDLSLLGERSGALGVSLRF